VTFNVKHDFNFQLINITKRICDVVMIQKTLTFNTFHSLQLARR